MTLPANQDQVGQRLDMSNPPCQKQGKGVLAKKSINVSLAGKESLSNYSSFMHEGQNAHPPVQPVQPVQPLCRLRLTVKGAAMPRTRRSAKAAGAKFERTIADHLAAVLDDDRIDRRVKMGNKDRGDVSGIRIHGQRLVVEVKDCARIDLPGWTAEAHCEAGNDDALLGVVIHKRHGVGDPGRQWVTMTVDDLAALIDGQRHGHRLDVVA